MEPLNEDQIVFVWRQVGRWLRLRAENPDSQNQKGPVQIVVNHVNYGYGEEQASRALYAQLAADAEHSALLRRLLSGKEPLPEPPPLKHSYPAYPD